MTMNLAEQAKSVAGAGRYGDTTLLHLNTEELKGIASIMPLTRNPDTGYPEAFLPFLIPLLMGAAVGGGSAALGGGGFKDILKGTLLGGALGGVTGGIGGLMGGGAAGAGAGAGGEAVSAMAGAAGPPSVLSTAPYAMGNVSKAVTGGSGGLGALGNIGSWIKKNPGLSMGIGAAAMPLMERMFGGGGGGGGEKESSSPDRLEAYRESSPNPGSPSQSGREVRQVGRVAYKPRRYNMGGPVLYQFGGSGEADDVGSRDGSYGGSEGFGGAGGADPAAGGGEDGGGGFFGGLFESAKTGLRNLDTRIQGRRRSDEEYASFNEGFNPSIGGGDGAGGFWSGDTGVTGSVGDVSVPGADFAATRAERLSQLTLPPSAGAVGYGGSPIQTLGQSGGIQSLSGPFQPSSLGLPSQFPGLGLPSQSLGAFGLPSIDPSGPGPRSASGPPPRGFGMGSQAAGFANQVAGKSGQNIGWSNRPTSFPGQGTDWPGQGLGWSGQASQMPGQDFGWSGQAPTSFPGQGTNWSSQAAAGWPGAGPRNQSGPMFGDLTEPGMGMNRFGYALGGEVAAGAEAGVHGEPSVQTNEDRQLVMDTVNAIKNKTSDRDTLMERFSSKFGSEALKSLMMRIASGEYDETADRISSGLGGEVKGPSGMIDGFPATDPDGKTAMLNNEEFVVPREMNAALGGGDPQRGIAALEGIRKQVMPV